LVRRSLADCSLIDEHNGDEVSGSCERYSVVGELLNTDVDPGDVTVTAQLYDDAGSRLTWYNAQQVMIHKLRPKEVTPFRVDFEGVAGTVLSDQESAGDFSPDAFSPFVLQAPIVAFDVYAKAVVTGRDLDRDLAVQDLAVTQAEDGSWQLTGTLRNIGTQEATIPHLLMTYYDDSGRVQWVDHAYIEEAVRPQRMRSFSLPLSSASDIQPMLDGGNKFSNNLQAEVGNLPEWQERIELPPELGFDTLRLSVQHFSGGIQ
jgi:hypothetical protein